MASVLLTVLPKKYYFIELSNLITLSRVPFHGGIGWVLKCFIVFQGFIEMDSVFDAVRAATVLSCKTLLFKETELVVQLSHEYKAGLTSGSVHTIYMAFLSNY